MKLTIAPTILTTRSRNNAYVAPHEHRCAQNARAHIKAEPHNATPLDCKPNASTTVYEHLHTYTYVYQTSYVWAHPVNGRHPTINRNNELPLELSVTMCKYMLNATLWKTTVTHDWTGRVQIKRGWYAPDWN